MKKGLYSLVHGILIGLVISAVFITLMETGYYACDYCKSTALECDFLSVLPENIRNCDKGHWWRAIYNYAFLISTCSGVVGFFYGLLNKNKEINVQGDLGTGLVVFAVAVSIVAYVYFSLCVGCSTNF